MDDRLALSVTHADGRVTRWGYDEVDAGAIPSDLQFSTAMPGGFRDLSCSLLRRIDLDYPDQALFDNVRAYGPGNQTAWDGRFTQFPRSHGQGFSVTPGAVGWSAHLKDDPSFREVYVDRSLTGWQPPSQAWKQGLITSNYNLTDPSTVPESVTGPAALQLSTIDVWASPSKPYSAATYDAGEGSTIASVYYDIALSTNLLNTLLISSAANTDAASSESSSNLFLSNTSGNFTPTTPRQVMRWELLHSATPGGASGTLFVYWIRRLAVFGGHGLTVRGTVPDQGYYASDIIADIVSRAAPLLSTDGVEQTDFVVPHAVFSDPITAEDALTLINSYHLWEWGVYDDRVFFYRPPDTERLVWEARLDKGAFLDLEGDTAEQVFNGVYVSYQDAVGQRRTIGPTGASANATSSLLEDTSETNPVNAHGIPRRWARLEISQPTTEAGAEQLGYVWLREHSLPQRRGNLTLTGSVMHPTEGEVPAWRPRAGDSVKITDGGVSDTPRRIISTSYNHGTRSISLSLDNTSLKLDAILERMGIGLVGVL
jgi:hypothetical protein